MDVPSSSSWVAPSSTWTHHERHPGGKADLRNAQSGDTSTVVGSLSGSSDRSSSAWQGRHKFIPWNELRLGHRIHPYCGHAHCADDVYLLAELLGLIQLPDVDGETVKLCLRALKFLHLCDYSDQDICSILSHASAYFMDAFDLCGTQMDSGEVGNVLVTLMFIAHCYVQDETCPLRIWHQHLFHRYCPLRTLNCAIIRLLEIRRFILRLDETELSNRFDCLQQAIQDSRMGSTSLQPELIPPGAASSSTSSAPSHRPNGSGGYPSGSAGTYASPTSTQQANGHGDDGGTAQQLLLSQVLEHFKYQSIESLWRPQETDPLNRPEASRRNGRGA